MMRQENMELKSEFLQVTAQQAQRNDTNNGTEILQNALRELETFVRELRDSNVVPRVSSVEARMQALEVSTPCPLPIKHFFKNFEWIGLQPNLMPLNLLKPQLMLPNHL